MPSLYEVIYVSRRSPGVTDDEVIDHIVLPSSRKNRTLDITGCLWFDDGRFLQLLEGPRAEVESVYAAIRADARHTAIETISQGPTALRSFSRWNMKAVGHRSDETMADLVGHYARRGGLASLPSTVERPGLIARLRDRLVGLTNAEVHAEA